FKERRDYVVKRIRNIEGLRCLEPQGAFYAFVNVRDVVEASGRFRDVDEWAKALLEEELVAVVPGSGFGSPDHIRISYATSMNQREEAMDRFERFVKKYRSVSRRPSLAGRPFLSRETRTWVCIAAAYGCMRLGKEGFVKARH